MKRRIWMGIFLVLLLLSSAVLPALAAEELNANGHSYTYTYWKDIVAAPVSYTGAEEIRLPELTDAVSLEDITVSSTGTIYAADSRGNCVYVLSASLSLTDTLREYTFEGETRQLIAPEGVYAGKDRLYVANTGGKNIVIYDYDGSCAGVIEEPPAEELSSTVEYEPIRVCADNGGRVYAIARNQTQGILQFSGMDSLPDILALPG